jgi:uncharacterized protein
MHISVIAKEPRPGFVKTRLCPPCSPEQAAALAAAALLDTLDAVDQLVLTARNDGIDLAPTLVFDGDPGAWTRPGYSVIPQRGGGLEERLANAFSDLGPGFIVGMESPHAISSIACALRSVQGGEDAIGLAEDGGYWVIGLGHVDSERVVDLFHGVPMSASNTGLAQLTRLHSHKRSVYLLPQARDLDTIDDVRAVAQRQTSGRLPDLARATLAKTANR